MPGMEHLAPLGDFEKDPNPGRQADPTPHFIGIALADRSHLPQSELVSKLMDGDKVSIEDPSGRQGTAQIFKSVADRPILAVQWGDESGTTYRPLERLDQFAVAGQLYGEVKDRPGTAPEASDVGEPPSDRRDAFRERAAGQFNELGPQGASLESNEGPREQASEVEPLREKLEAHQEPPLEQPDAPQDPPPVRSTSLGPDRSLSYGAFFQLSRGETIEYRGDDGTRVAAQLIRGDEPGLLWSASKPGQEENPQLIHVPLGDNYRDADGRELSKIIENLKAGFYPNYNPSEA